MIKKKIFNCKYGQPLGYKLNKVYKIFYKELTTEDEATRWATEYYSNWSATYDETYRSNKIGMFTTYVYSYDSIRFYCGHIAERLNSLLRNKNNVYYREILNSLYALSDSLVTILFQAPKIPENLILYRYVPDVVITELLKRNKLEQYYIEYGFLSCTLLKQKSIRSEFEDANNILKIFVNKDTLGVYTNLLQGNNRQEYEVILLKDTKLYLIDYPYIDTATGKYIYEVHAIYK